ncbi:hypothetical protein A3Q56_00932 [Intoshia linei]|uniref:Uncharacterized protein n=1 Tax=Intoshia linei TaxID=1819745 RepID=A0A177BAS7_9BILA|nr:hypothetical protein A3Q56_00932 [Intoshia linei]
MKRHGKSLSKKKDSMKFSMKLRSSTCSRTINATKVTENNSGESNNTQILMKTEKIVD